MTYNPENVRAGKLAAAGGVYTGPTTTEPPTDASTPLAAGFVSLGLAGPDGLNITPERTVEEWRDQRGVVIRRVTTEAKDVYEVQLLETNAEVLTAVFGSQNVTVDGNLVTVKHNAELPPPASWVFELLDGENARREYIPSGQVAAPPEQTFNSSEPIDYTVSIETGEDSDGNFAYSFIEVGGGIVEDESPSL